MAKQHYEGERERSGRRPYEDYEAGRGWSERGRQMGGSPERAGEEGRSRYWDDEAQRRRRYEEWRAGYDRENERYETRSGYGREPYGSEAERKRGYEGGYDRSYDRGYGAGSGWSNRGYESEPYGGYGNRGFERGSYGNYESQGYGTPGYSQGYGQGDSQNYGQSYGQGYGQSYSGYEGGGMGGYGTESYGNRGVGQNWSSTYDNEWGQGSFSGSQRESWQQRGQHTGRGPQGYKRSDQRIEEDVNEELTRHGGVDASQIQVSVKEGEVTLSGTVNSRAEKRLAEDCIENCSGVKQVHNQLRVQSQNQSQQNEQRQGTQSSNTIQTDVQKRSAAR